MVGRCEPNLPDSFRDYIERVVSEAPPLTPEQKADLRQILRPVVIARRETAGAR